MSSMLGKIGIFGPGGAGKTRLLVEIVNQVSGNKYPWHEEKNFIGSLAVTPFSVLFPLSDKSVKVVFTDNPGQNSLESLRLTAAKKSGEYIGFILVVDGTSWNFRDVALWHAKAIEKHISKQFLPITFIVNKSDLAKLLLGKLGRSIGEIIEEAFEHLKNFDKVFYYNRVTGREEFFQVTSYEGWMPFTQVEQFLTNSLDAVFMRHQVPGFTQVNIRIFVRALLLGFCEFYQEYYPDYIKSNPIFNAIDDELVNSLNYFRGTSYETSTPFNVLAAQSKTGLTHKKEIPFHKSTFEKRNIIFIIHKYVVAHLSNFKDFISKLQNDYPNWHLINSIYSNCVTSDGLDSVNSSFSSLLTFIDSKNPKKPSKPKLTYDQLGLEHFK